MKKIWSGNSSRGRRAPRDYHRKRYDNPLFPRPSMRRKPKRNGIVERIPYGWMIGALGVLAASWYLVWSPAFRIDEVRINGASPSTEAALRRVANDRLRRTTFGVLPQSNIFFFVSGAMKQDINDGFAFASLEVRKQLPHAVVITVSEKMARAALDEGGRFFALDGDGTVIRELTNQELSEMRDLPTDVGSAQVQGLGAQVVEVGGPHGTAVAPKAGNKNGLPLIMAAETKVGPPKPGDRAVPPEALSLILQAYSRLPDIIGAGVRRFAIPGDSETVDALVEGDWHVLMATSLPFDVQGERLSLVLKDKIGDKRSQLDYIDLRYNERIFFKFKNAQ